MSIVELLPMPNGTISPQLLDPDHYQVFQTALENILSLDISRNTIAQLFDGLPTWHVFLEAAGLRNFIGAPIREHKTLCAGAMDRADAFISTFDPVSLQIDSSLLQAFQDAALGSEQFKLRLLELVARSVHCIATSIDKLAAKSHQGNIQEAIDYVYYPMGCDSDGEDNGKKKGLRGLPAFENLFFNVQYRNTKEYPFGPSDMAGYWAEDRIFGGVVLFDRGESGNEANSVWFHSGRKYWTTRIWKPLNWQWTSMTEFLLNGPPDKENKELISWEGKLLKEVKDRMTEQWKSEFPYFCDIDNPVRHDTYDAMAYHNIYRDKWERDLSKDKSSFRPRNEFDYPEIRELHNILLNEIGAFHEDPPDQNQAKAEESEEREAKRRRRSSAGGDCTSQDSQIASDDDSKSNIIGTFGKDGFQYADHHKNRLTANERQRGPVDRPKKRPPASKDADDSGSDSGGFKTTELF